jgi:hypothetical protein
MYRAGDEEIPTILYLLSVLNLSKEFCMKNALRLLATLAVCAAVLLSLSFPLTAAAQQSDKSIASRTKDVDGLQFHYFTAGHGPAVVLIHGYAETSLTVAADHSDVG